MGEAIKRIDERLSVPQPSAPKENVSAIHLRSGKRLEIPVGNQKSSLNTDAPTLNTDAPALLPGAPAPPSAAPALQPAPKLENSPVSEPFVDTYVRPNFPPLGSEKPKPPFPEALKERRVIDDSELFETFSRCAVNIPILKLIKGIPKYAKFLKELCTVKRNQKNNAKKKVQVNEQVSAIFQKKQMPEKCKDPGMITIPCTIGETKIPHAMLDLGASINVLPYSLYESLGLGPLHETRTIVQLADKSTICPRGILEDVLVMVGNLVFPADFYVLDMANDMHEAPILLGRPFIKTARTRIDCVTEILSMEFGDDKIEFNLYDTMKHATHVHSLCAINVIEPAAVSDPNIMKPVTDEELDEWGLEYGLSPNLQGRMPKFEEKGIIPLHPLGTGPTLLTKSARLADSVLQKPKVKQKHSSGSVSKKVRTKLWWVPKKAREPPDSK